MSDEGWASKDALQAQLELAKQVIEDLVNKNRLARQQLDDLPALVARCVDLGKLVERAAGYTEHDSRCQARPQQQPCSCGLDDWLRDVAKNRPMGKTVATMVRAMRRLGYNRTAAAIMDKMGLPMPLRVYKPLAHDHPLVTTEPRVACPFCMTLFEPGQRTILAELSTDAIQLQPGEIGFASREARSLTVEASPVHARCALEGRTTKYGVIVLFADEDVEAPIVVEDGSRHTLAEIGLDG